MLQRHVAKHKEEAGEGGHVVQAARRLAARHLAALLRARGRLAALVVACLALGGGGRVRSIGGIGTSTISLHGLAALLNLLALLSAAGAVALLHAGLLAVGSTLGRGRKRGARQVAQHGGAQVLGRGVQRVQGGERRLCGAVPGCLGQRGGNHHPRQGSVHAL